MATPNNFTINGQVILNTGDMTYRLVLTIQITLISTNIFCNTETFYTNVYKQIDMGTATDLRYIALSNNNITASIQICQNTSSVQNMTILKSGDTAVFPFSGSINLYAKMVSGESTGSLQYILVAK